MQGYGPAWRRDRAQVLAEEPWCVGYPAGLHRDRPVRATDVDHVKARRAGGGEERANKRPLCHSCHSRKTATEDHPFGKARRAG